MQIEKYVLGPIATNAYLIYEDGCGIVIDPGMNPDVLLERIGKLNVTIEAICLTHCHFDHIGGLAELRELTQAPVIVHELEQAWIVDPVLNGSASYSGAPALSFAPAEIVVKDGDKLSFFGHDFHILFTPGHSPGSISLLAGDIVFSGDALFKGAIGRTDLRGGNYNALIEGIEAQLFSLDDTVIVHPGHGASTTIGHERKTNPFFS